MMGQHGWIPKTSARQALASHASSHHQVGLCSEQAPLTIGKPASHVTQSMTENLQQSRLSLNLKAS